jgi:hypothetical protein
MGRPDSVLPRTIDSTDQKTSSIVLPEGLQTEFNLAG